MPDGLADYASPILRMAVFRQLHPGATVSYTVCEMQSAFPTGHTEYEGKATEAVRCEIIFDDGTFIVAHKEIDRVDNRNRAIVQTPEELAKNETKAMGRALRDAGIPQRLSELKLLMQWIASMNGSSPGRVTPVDGGVPVPEEQDEDAADAGAEDPTPEQVVAHKFAMLSGADKAAVVKHAREAYSLSNVLRSGDMAEAMLTYIEGRSWIAEAPEEPF